MASQSHVLASVDVGAGVGNEAETRGGTSREPTVTAATAAEPGAVRAAATAPSESKGGATYAIVFVVIAVVASYAVLKLRRASV